MGEKKKNQTWEIILKVMASAIVGALGNCGMPGKVVKQKKGILADALSYADGIVLCHFFQTLHHGEHEDGREYAEDNEDAPNGYQRYVAPELRTYLGEEVTQCGGYEPTTHHHTFQLRRCYLGYEADTHW